MFNYDDYTIQQSGTSLSMIGDANRIVVNKYSNKVTRIFFEVDELISGERLYAVLQNPITNRYRFLPLMDDNSIIITRMITNYVGAWSLLLVAVSDEISEDEELDNSKVTFVSDVFRRLVVKDNFLDEDKVDLTEPGTDPMIDEILDNIVKYENQVFETAALVLETYDNTKQVYEDTVDFVDQAKLDINQIITGAKLEIDETILDFRNELSAFSSDMDSKIESGKSDINDLVDQFAVTAASDKSDIESLTQAGIDAINETSEENLEIINASIKEAEGWAHGHADYPQLDNANAMYYSKLAERHALDAIDSADVAEMAEAAARASAGLAESYKISAQTAEENALEYADNASASASAASNTASQFASYVTSAKNEINGTIDVVNGIADDVDDMKASVELTKSSVEDMKSSVNDMKNSVEATKTSMDNTAADIEARLDKLGTVKSVNGNVPDDDGSVHVPTLKMEYDQDTESIVFSFT